MAKKYVVIGPHATFNDVKKYIVVKHKEWDSYRIKRANGYHPPFPLNGAFPTFAEATEWCNTMNS